MKLAALAFVVPFLIAVSSRCAGEAGWPEGVHLCACTVASRLAHGWTEGNVLSAYYARDTEPTEQMTEAAEKGLRNEACPVDAYFLFEQYSISKLNLNKTCATGQSDGNGKSIWSFPYKTFKEDKCYADQSE